MCVCTAVAYNPSSKTAGIVFIKAKQFLKWSMTKSEKFDCYDINTSIFKKYETFKVASETLSMHCMVILVVIRIKHMLRTSIPFSVYLTQYCRTNQFFPKYIKHIRQLWIGFNLFKPYRCNHQMVFYNTHSSYLLHVQHCGSLSLTIVNPQFSQ